MNRHGQSREQYEDDILAFLMDGMLEEEGRALLEENERLNTDPAAAIPAELDERCRALLRSAFPDEPLKKPERMTWKIMKRVLIAAVIAATLFATAYAAVPEFRAGVLNFWTEVKEIGTYFYFYSSGEKTPAPTPASSSPLVIKDGMPFEFSYVPEGYEPFMTEARDEGIGMDYICAYCKPNDDPNNFSFEIEPLSEDAGLLVDTEDAQVTEMKIRGFDGYRIEKIHSRSGRQRIMYLWFDLENKLIFFYDSVGVLPEESQRIFDGIVIYGYETDAPAPTPAPSSPLVIKDGMPFEFTYIPKEYELLVREALDSDTNMASYFWAYGYPNDDANNFSFLISPLSDGSSLFADTEDALITNVKIHGFDGKLIQKTDALTDRECVAYLWLDLDSRLMFHYASVGIPIEEAQRIFDGIVIYE